MKQKKHTPGKWETGAVMTRVEVLPEGWKVPICIADCHDKNAPKNETERVANARLIAAAPDLLSALERIAECKLREEGGRLDKYDANGYIHIAREAIAKATKGE